MAFIKSEFTIPSVVGDCDLRGSRWLPKNGEVRAVLQIIHGMLEHIGRYDAFADFFTSRGFAVYGVSHLGHGLSVNEKYPRGYFGEHNGNGVVFRDDAHQLSDVIRQEQLAISNVSENVGWRGSTLPATAAIFRAQSSAPPPGQTR